MPSALRVAAIVTVIASGSGCFSYAEVDLATVQPGEEIRVQLTPAGVAQLDGVSGTFISYSERGPLLQGTISRREGERLVIGPRVQGSRSATFRIPGAPPAVPVRFGDIVRVERRELHRTRSFLAVAGTIGALAVVSFVLLDLDTRPAVVIPDPVDPPENRVPIFHRLP